MGKLLDGYRTREGDTLKKIEGDDGTVTFHKNGKFLSGGKDAFNGYKSRLAYMVTDHKGELPQSVQQASTLAEYEDVTGIPFQAETFRPISEGETKQHSERAEANRWLGFRLRNRQWSDEKAAQEYLHFRNEIQQAESAEARAIIKSQYNLGGS